ncbi:MULTISPECIES: hypothetical protein [unclassified Pseudoclavibacter]|uniref:hypothetical protein n=1 Tax=unclassified Pseudoclavibacter TaxID=2615177 RepID=UPI001BAD9479|nr:hypothetical protein [Pseudoclavibacter sp. Marseille-Q4354]MBS3177768.1 hypothetical protein [Pseudoclavibacter sp. Marseille-Q4354]
MSERIRVTARPRQAVRVQTRYVIPAPEAGWSLELQQTETHLQVRQVRDEETRPWVDVVALAELAGPAGAVPVFAVVDGALAYRFGDSGPWGQLLTIESLKGNDGLSAYQLWVAAGNVGTVVEFLESLKGETPELPSFVASSTVGVVGSVPSVALEEIDGEARFKFVLPPPRDGVSPPPLSLSVTSSEVGQGQPMTASLSGSYPNLTLALGLRAGTPGGQGDPGPQGASGMPNVDLVGTVMPNGVVTAAPGTIYRDTTVSNGLLGTNGASLWIKASGTGNTGWRVLDGDTGWRRIDQQSFFKQSATTTLMPIISTRGLLVRRTGNRIDAKGYRVTIDRTQEPSAGPWIIPPSGFAPDGDLYWPWSRWDSTAQFGLYWSGTAFFASSGVQNPWAGTTNQLPTTTFSWTTAQAWPTSLPGTPG